MKLQDIKVGRNYKIKDGGKFVKARLDNVSSKNDKPRLELTALTTGRKITVATLAAVVEEIPFDIKTGDLVRSIKGGKKEINRIYKVERVEGKDVYLMSGGTGKELKVSLASVRHVNDGDPPKCFAIGCTRGVTETFEGKPCCITHYKTNQEDEDRPDPTMITSVSNAPQSHAVVENYSPTIPKSRFDRFTARIQGKEVAPFVPKIVASSSYLEGRIRELEVENERLKNEIQELKDIERFS